MELIRNFSLAILIWIFGWCLFWFLKGFFKTIYKELITRYRLFQLYRIKRDLEKRIEEFIKKEFNVNNYKSK